MKPAVADSRFRVICLRIEPLTGSPIYLTHHPRDLVMSGHTYLSTSGYDFTGYSSAASTSPSMVDLQGIAGLAGIGYDEINSGVFDNARAYLYATTWNSPVEDEEEIVASILGKTTLRDDTYTIEEMALIDVLNQSVGKTYTELMEVIYGRLPDGTLVSGVETFRQLYAALGFGPVVALTRLPGVRHALEVAYHLFAKNRLRLTGRCLKDDQGNCTVPT